MKGFVVGGDFATGKRGGNQVRGTKYEVAKLWRAACGKEGGNGGEVRVLRNGRAERESAAWGRWEAKRKNEVEELGATELRKGKPKGAKQKTRAEDKSRQNREVK